MASIMLQLEENEENVAAMQPETVHSVKIEARVKQLCKGQDATFRGHTIDDATGETFDWTMCCDGHGTNSCISAIRSIPPITMNKMIASSEPVQRMALYLLRTRSVSPGEQSGATMCLVKCYANRIVCINCGDSQSTVYKNGERVHITKVHNWSNAEERTRVIDMQGRFSKSSSFALVTENHMKEAYSEYANFMFGPMLACTQALGHNSVTKYAPDVIVIPYNSTDIMRVVSGSDGLWDMVIENNIDDIIALRDLSCEQILNRYVNRWMQDWDMEDPATGILEKSKFGPREYDDVSVIVIDITPII
jgi:serine/threonine protein phosphatase PrpC